MFTVPTRRPRGLIGQAELIFHATVREIRKGHRNALVVLLMSIVQAAVFVLAFFVLFQMLGMRGAALRGDFLLYIMSGIFLYLTHIKAMSAVIGSESSTSPMMHHAPMNSIIAIASAALASLYTQFLSLVAVLSVYHIGFKPISIDAPAGAMGMFLIAWFSGVAIGVVFRALKPWFPEAIDIISTIYIRANMIASGKMFVANSLPSAMLPFFDWNPLFHAIDQGRGFVFLHYNPHFTSTTYPILLSLVLLMIGFMIEFYTQKNASASWSAGR